MRLQKHVGNSASSASFDVAMKEPSRHWCEGFLLGCRQLLIASLLYDPIECLTSQTKRKQPMAVNLDQTSVGPQPCLPLQKVTFRGAMRMAIHFDRNKCSDHDSGAQPGVAPGLAKQRVAGRPQNRYR